MVFIRSAIPSFRQNGMVDEASGQRMRKVVFAIGIEATVWSMFLIRSELQPMNLRSKVL